MTEAPVTAGDQPAPALRRRLACFLYEGVLLFGVLMAAGLVYGVVTQQRHALRGHLGLQVFLFVVLGAYFVWFWTRSGQTLAMQTWRIRLLTRSGAPVTKPRALARYVASWVWFLPALAMVNASGLHSAGAVFAALAANVLAWAALSRLHPQRQYWHDAVCGTQLVDWAPVRRP